MALAAGAEADEHCARDTVPGSHTRHRSSASGASGASGTSGTIRAIRVSDANTSGRTICDRAVESAELLHRRVPASLGDGAALASEARPTRDPCSRAIR